jgi:hypothetical protein
LLLLLTLPLAWWLQQPAALPALTPAQWLLARSVLALGAVLVALLVFATGYRAILSARKGAVLTLGWPFWRSACSSSAIS